jgi:4-oxalocrotonate tautomerase
MPIIQFNLLEGRTVEQKRELARRVTQTVTEVLGVKPEVVRILIHQVTGDDFSVGGVTAAERAATTPAKT